MLVFAGANTDDNSLRFTIPSQRKLAKRPSRSKKSDLQNGMRTPTNQSTQNPSALELLSRSAPVASSKRYARNDLAMDGLPPITPTKRPSSHLEHFHTAGGQVTPTFAKRKYTRRSSNKLPFEERIQEVSLSVVDLPSVDDTVTNVYDARNTEGVGDPELTLLSRSLLQTAMTVELAEDEEQITSAATDHSPAKPQTEHGSEALSPTSAGLYCEEEYSEAVADDDNHLANGDGIATTAGNEPDSSGQRSGKASLSAMQERAVLQEFSVWLRNLVSGVSPY
ncbi:hypothetical protein DVH05_009538 [Phytophthora capsici]|nr:hypothetical protein DVH05_009538 [Phytophthora capsici]